MNETPPLADAETDEEGGRRARRPSSSVDRETATAGALRLSPLPSPEELRAYGEVVPGLEKIFVDRWVLEGDRRHALQSRGQIFALVMGLSIVIGATILGLYSSWAGALAIAGAGAFAFGVAQLANTLRTGAELAHLDVKLASRRVEKQHKKKKSRT